MRRRHYGEGSGTPRVFSEPTFPFGLLDFLISLQFLNAVGIVAYQSSCLCEVRLLKCWMKIIYFM